MKINTQITSAKHIAIELLGNGYEAYYIGGCVRDGLLGLPVKDIDIATSATPNQVQQLFPGSDLVGARFGVVIVRSGEFNFEVTTFRKDGKSDGRRPESVDFGTLAEDANRRDFTINALYQKPSNGEIYDFHGGLSDLNKKIIKCVGDPYARFKEDALRMLRAIRFAAKLNFKLEKNTFDALVTCRCDLVNISAERIRDELDRMITGPNPSLAIDLLTDTKLLDVVLPEITDLIGIEQNPIYHPEGDVFFHTKLALEKLEPRTSTNAWACLLHDVGKVNTTKIGDDGQIHANEHHKEGADIAREIVERLRFSSKQAEQIVHTVYDHMKPMHVRDMKRSTLRRFLALDHIDTILAVHKADCLASNGNLNNLYYIQEIQKQLENEPIIPPPLIKGQHLLSLSIPPGPIYGKILRQIQTLQLEGKITNTDQAMDYIEKFILPIINEEHTS